MTKAEISRTISRIRSKRHRRRRRKTALREAKNENNQAADDEVPELGSPETVVVGKGYRYRSSNHENGPSVRKFNRDEHAHTDIPDRGPESVEVLDLTVEDRKDWGAPSAHSSDVVQWSIGMYTPVVKEIAKGSGFWCKRLKSPVHCRNARDDGTHLGTRSLQGAAF